MHEYQRRIGDYDRFLVQGAGAPANVVLIDPSRGGDPLPEPDQNLGTERT